MNVLFMSLTNYKTLYFHSLYPDLLRQFISRGDKIYVLSPVERRLSEKEHVINEDGVTIAKVRIWNMQKTNTVEKAISMLTIDRILIRAIKKYFSDVKFDLILYPTPPITLLNTIKYVKKRDSSITYLLLKDIFPQNAVDINLMSKNGIKGMIYKYFRRKEKRLYSISDHIGCMSKANVDYLIRHNPEVDANKVEVCPNAYEPIDMSCSEEDRVQIRSKYQLPSDKKVFVYGGNLGKPQGISFFIDCLRAVKETSDAFFLIVGDGTEYGKLKRFIDEEKPSYVMLKQRLPKEDYDKMIGSCDVGLVFLDHRFTIPNYPSRILSYMQAKLPVLACTDPNTDIGKDIMDGGFGWWCESDKPESFSMALKKALSAEDMKQMGEKGFDYLVSHFSSAKAYEIIANSIGKNR